MTRSPLGLALAVALLALPPAGCGRGPRQITPTTLGTDLRRSPRGRMTPPPFPGNDLARSRPIGPTVDPGAINASAEAAPR